MPICAKTGMPARDRPHRTGVGRRAVELDHIGPGLLDEAQRRAHRDRRAFLQRTEREVDADERALDAAPHRLADDDHLVHRHFQQIRLAPQIDADGIADRDDIDARAVDDLRELVVPDDHADDLATVALHLLEGGDDDGVGRWGCHSGSLTKQFNFLDAKVAKGREGREENNFNLKLSIEFLCVLCALAYFASKKLNLHFGPQPTSPSVPRAKSESTSTGCVMMPCSSADATARSSIAWLGAMP